MATRRRAAPCRRDCRTHLASSTRDPASRATRGRASPPPTDPRCALARKQPRESVIPLGVRERRRVTELAPSRRAEPPPRGSRASRPPPGCGRGPEQPRRTDRRILALRRRRPLRVQAHDPTRQNSPARNTGRHRATAAPRTRCGEPRPSSATARREQLAAPRRCRRETTARRPAVREVRTGAQRRDRRPPRRAPSGSARPARGGTRGSRRARRGRRRLLEPEREALVEVGPRRFRQRVVGGVADQQCRKRKASSSGSVAVAAARAPCGPAHELAGIAGSSGRGPRPPRDGRPAPRPRRARAPPLAGLGSWSRRAASSAWIVGGTPPRRPRESRTIASISSTKSGLPSGRARIRSRSPLASSAAPSRRSISSSVSLSRQAAQATPSWR